MEAGEVYTDPQHRFGIIDDPKDGLLIDVSIFKDGSVQPVRVPLNPEEKTEFKKNPESMETLFKKVVADPDAMVKERGGHWVIQMRIAE